MTDTLRECCATTEHDTLTTILNWLDDNMTGRLNSHEVVAALEGAFADVLVPALADEYRNGTRCAVCGGRDNDGCTNDC